MLPDAPLADLQLRRRRERLAAVGVLRERARRVAAARLFIPKRTVHEGRAGGGRGRAHAVRLSPREAARTDAEDAPIRPGGSQRSIAVPQLRAAGRARQGARAPGAVPLLPVLVRLLRVLLRQVPLRRRRRRAGRTEQPLRGLRLRRRRRGPPVGRVDGLADDHAGRRPSTAAGYPAVSRAAALAPAMLPAEGRRGGPGGSRVGFGDANARRRLAPGPRRRVLPQGQPRGREPGGDVGEHHGRVLASRSQRGRAGRQRRGSRRDVAVRVRYSRRPIEPGRRSPPLAV